MLLFKSHFKPLLEQGLRDDGWPWDWSSLPLPDKEVRAKIIAKAPGTWAGRVLCEAANQLYAELSSNEPVWPGLISGALQDGARVESGQVCCELKGRASLIMALERPLLNLIGYASGVATKTRQFVDAARDVAKNSDQTPRITATRKTLPGYRDLSVYGLMAGGGISHRVSLSGGIMLKENHIAAYGGIAKAVENVRRVSPHGLKVEVEVRDLGELEQALVAGAEVIMLDNFSGAQVKSAVELISAKSALLKIKPVIEVSGGVKLETIREYVLPGVDVISIGALTHSVSALDLSLLVDAP